MNKLNITSIFLWCDIIQKTLVYAQEFNIKYVRAINWIYSETIKGQLPAQEQLFTDILRHDCEFTTSHIQQDFSGINEMDLSSMHQDELWHLKQRQYFLAFPLSLEKEEGTLHYTSDGHRRKMVPDWFSESPYGGQLSSMVQQFYPMVFV